MENLAGIVKSGGRETFWACLVMLVILGGFAIRMDSNVGLELFKTSITPVMALGLGVFGFHKVAGLMATKVK